VTQFADLIDIYRDFQAVFATHGAAHALRHPQGLFGFRDEALLFEGQTERHHGRDEVCMFRGLSLVSQISSSSSFSFFLADPGTVHADKSRIADMFSAFLGVNVNLYIGRELTHVDGKPVLQHLEVLFIKHFFV